MVFDEPFERILDDCADFEPQLLGGFLEFVLIEPSDRADEIDRELRAVIQVDVPHEELCEAVDDEVMDFWNVTVACTERRERSKETVGH